MARTSSHTCFRIGTGLPGLAWPGCSVYLFFCPTWGVVRGFCAKTVR